MAVGSTVGRGIQKYDVDYFLRFPDWRPRNADGSTPKPGSGTGALKLGAWQPIATGADGGAFDVTEGKRLSAASAADHATFISDTGVGVKLGDYVEKNLMRDDTGDGDDAMVRTYEGLQDPQTRTLTFRIPWRFQGLGELFRLIMVDARPMGAHRPFDLREVYYDVAKVGGNATELLVKGTPAANQKNLTIDGTKRGDIEVDDLIVIGGHSYHVVSVEEDSANSDVDIQLETDLLAAPADNAQITREAVLKSREQSYLAETVTEQRGQASFVYEISAQARHRPTSVGI